MSLPTLTDLKSHANVTSTADDDELQDMLDAAVDVVERLAGPLTASSVTEVHAGAPNGVLALRRMPVAAVLTVSTRGATLSALDYDLDAEAGLLYFSRAVWGTVTVSYTSGHAVLPASIRLAVLIIAAHLWETQRGTAPTALALQNPDALDQGTFGAGFVIPNRAKELLAPYVRPSIA